MALAGGVNLILAPDLFVALSHSRMLAPDGRCKTFDAAADGFARGEGCGVVVLKRLSDAQADGDRVLAVIRGSAVNQDGPSSSLTAPNGPAQEAVIRAALAFAGIAPGRGRLHRGPRHRDPARRSAGGPGPRRGVRPDRPTDRPLIVGSVKTNIGHLEAAAGVAGLIKVVLALQTPGNSAAPAFRHTQPAYRLARLPLLVPAAGSWEPIDGRRIGGVSSFGFSGTNAHVILEEAAGDGLLPPGTQRGGRICSRCPRVIPRRWRELAERYADTLAEMTGVELADICRTANAGRAHFPSTRDHRRVHHG